MLKRGGDACGEHCSLWPPRAQNVHTTSDGVEPGLIVCGLRLHRGGAAKQATVAIASPTARKATQLDRDERRCSSSLPTPPTPDQCATTDVTPMQTVQPERTLLTAAACWAAACWAAVMSTRRGRSSFARSLSPGALHQMKSSMQPIPEFLGPSSRASEGVRDFACF